MPAPRNAQRPLPRPRCASAKSLADPPPVQVVDRQLVDRPHPRLAQTASAADWLVDAGDAGPLVPVVELTRASLRETELT
ncbi:hypothetical protein J132_07174 [Termitomyces sp. J132]|nr:hypothetical protein J132_07174 [Termitomyces sp. J132]